MKIRHLCVCMAGAAALTGCGAYTPAPVILPPHIQSIAVATVQNNTPQYGLEDDLTRRVIDEFIRDGRIRVTNEGTADGVVEATITRYILEPLSYDENHIVEENKLWVLVDLQFVDRVRNRVLWDQSNLQGSHRYFVESRPGGLTEEQARTYVWDNIARDIVKRTIEGFGSVSGASDRLVPRGITEE